MKNDFVNLCVFCGSSPAVDPVYKAEAERLGRLCAVLGWSVVYGGSANGLMGAAADAALAGGGKVIGIMPDFLKTKENAHGGLTKFYTVKTMHERQKRMADLSDAFVIMPGGLGTLAEFFEVITWKQLKLHEKPVVVVNINGYWNELLGMIKSAVEQKFLNPAPNLFSVITEVEKLPEALGRTTPLK